MYRKILLAGTTAAVIVGAGGTALALTGSDTTSGSPSAGSSSSAKAGHAGKKGKHKKGKHGRLGKRLEHGQFTLKGKDGKTTTVDVINGTVTAVSPTSITVQAADKKTETFSVSSSTKVVQRTEQKKQTGSGTSGSGTKTKGEHKGTKITIGQVKKGDHVSVLGTGTSNYAAKRIADIKS